MLILWIFFKVVLGSDGGRWIVVGGGGLYLWLWEVVEGCACVWWLVWAVFFFFWGCGFYVIMGDGKVGLIPCELDCINGVDSSLHFSFFRVLC